METHNQKQKYKYSKQEARAPKVMRRECDEFNKGKVKTKSPSLHKNHC